MSWYGNGTIPKPSGDFRVGNYDQRRNAGDAGSFIFSAQSALIIRILTAQPFQIWIIRFGLFVIDFVFVRRDFLQNAKPPAEVNDWCFVSIVHCTDGRLWQRSEIRDQQMMTTAGQNLAFFAVLLLSPLSTSKLLKQTFYSMINKERLRECSH